MFIMKHELIYLTLIDRRIRRFTFFEYRFLKSV